MMRGNKGEQMKQLRYYIEIMDGTVAVEVDQNGELNVYRLFGDHEPSDLEYEQALFVLREEGVLWND